MDAATMSRNYHRIRPSRSPWSNDRRAPLRATQAACKSRARPVDGPAMALCAPSQGPQISRISVLRPPSARSGSRGQTPTRFRASGEFGPSHRTGRGVRIRVAVFRQAEFSHHDQKPPWGAQRECNGHQDRQELRRSSVVSAVMRAIIGLTILATGCSWQVTEPEAESKCLDGLQDFVIDSTPLLPLSALEAAEVLRPAELGLDWQWPTAGQFLEDWREWPTQRPPILIVAQLGRRDESGSVDFAAARGMETFATVELQATETGGTQNYQIQPYVQSAGGWTPHTLLNCRPTTASTDYFECDDYDVRVLESSLPAELHRQAWLERSYVATLLRFEGGPYDIESTEGFSERSDHYRRFERAAKRGKSGLGAVKRIFADWQRAGMHDEGRAEVIEYFEKFDPNAAELAALYARYQPMGRCSQDTRPQTVAASYADYCYRTRRLGKFLNLRVQLAGNYFSRVAWSGWTEQNSPPKGDALLSLGLDVERFMFGLLWQFSKHDDAEKLGAWRWARTVHEGGMAALLRPTLEARVQDEQLDPLNRFLATLALAQLDALQHGGDGSLTADVQSRLESMALHSIARRWLMQEHDVDAG